MSALEEFILLVAAALALVLGAHWIGTMTGSLP